MLRGGGAPRTWQPARGEQPTGLTATRNRLRCGMRARLARPLLGTDVVTWRNTSRAIQLFVHASLRERAQDAARQSDEIRHLSYMFTLGAVEAAGDLVGLSTFGRHRIEHRILRDTDRVSRRRARRLRRDLEGRSHTQAGRNAFAEGRAALIEWFRGEDPCAHLRALLERTRRDPTDRPQPPLSHRGTAQQLAL